MEFGLFLILFGVAMPFWFLYSSSQDEKREKRRALLRDIRDKAEKAAREAGTAAREAGDVAWRLRGVERGGGKIASALHAAERAVRAAESAKRSADDAARAASPIWVD